MKYYVFGDIHGREDMLAVLLNNVLDDEDYGQLEQGNSSTLRVIFLGDYIDRGPQSKQVLELVRALQDEYPEAVFPLRGNHEDMAVDSIKGSDHFYNFIMNGGKQTLESFGTSEFPQEWIDWIENKTSLYYASPSFFFCHAGGLRRDLPIFKKDLDANGKFVLAQHKHSLIWERTDSDYDFGPRIVHGHTPIKDILHKNNRTNIDTAAVFGGRLTCGVFDDEDRDLFLAIQIDQKLNIHRREFKIG